MVNKVKPQGRVLRHLAEDPSSQRIVAGTSTHVDATPKMMTGPTPNMAFLDNYLPNLTSDLNTPDIDLKAFDFGKGNAKSKLNVTGMGLSNMTNSPQTFQANTAFFDMSISSPPSFGEDNPTSPQNNRIADPYSSQEVKRSMMPTELVEDPIPKAPLLTNSQNLGFNNVTNANNPVTQPSQVPFDIPNDIYNDILFQDVDLGFDDDDDQLINSQNLDIYLQNDTQLLNDICLENDILSQAIAGAELPSSEQLNELLQTPGMMPPIIAQEQPMQLASVHPSPAEPVPSHTYHYPTRPQTAPQEIIIPQTAPQEIIIPNIFLDTSEYQTITYQVQEYNPSQIQQVQNNSLSDNVQIMEVDPSPSNVIDSKPLESTNFNFLPSLLTTDSPSTVELTEEIESKPFDIIYNEVPSTSTGKRKRASQKPARYRDSIIESPIVEYQPSTSVKVEKKLRLTDEEKYNRIRIMNNVASRKCRQRRKNDVKQTAMEIVELENKQKILKAKEAELIKQRDKMKALYCEFMKRQMAPR